MTTTKPVIEVMAMTTMTTMLTTIMIISNSNRLITCIYAIPHFINNALFSVIKDTRRVINNKGSSIYDVHKKTRFSTPPSVHVSTIMSRTPPPCGRPHAVDMKYTWLS